MKWLNKNPKREEKMVLYKIGTSEMWIYLRSYIENNIREPTKKEEKTKLKSVTSNSMFDHFLSHEKGGEGGIQVSLCKPTLFSINLFCFFFIFLVFCWQWFLHCIVYKIWSHDSQIWCATHCQSLKWVEIRTHRYLQAKQTVTYQIWNS